MKYLFVFSSMAGCLRMNQPIISNLLAELKKAGASLVSTDDLSFADLNYFITENYDETKMISVRFREFILSKYVKEDGVAEEKIKACVYVCGGDGSVHEVALALYNSDIALGIIPTGTANDFASYLYMKNTDYYQKKWRDEDFTLSACLNASYRKIDSIDTDWENCINVLSLCYDVQVGDYANKLKKYFPSRGRLCYGLAVLFSLFHKKSYLMHYELVDAGDKIKKFSMKTSLLAIANAQYYGNGFRPAPEASVEDGLLDICYVEKLNLLEFISLIKAYRSGEHILHPKVHYHKIKAAKISYDKYENKGIKYLAEGEGIVFEADSLNVKVAEKNIYLALPAYNIEV